MKVDLLKVKWWVRMDYDIDKLGVKERSKLVSLTYRQRLW